MKEIDWVVMPSIWWENSPIVIQEAFSFGRPLVVSGMGGMAEKVQDGVNGIHVRPNDPQSLADGLMRAALSERMWTDCSANIKNPPNISQTVNQVVDIYRKLLAKSP